MDSARGFLLPQEWLLAVLGGGGAARGGMGCWGSNQGRCLDPALSLWPKHLGFQLCQDQRLMRQCSELPQCPLGSLPPFSLFFIPLPFL